MKVHFYKNPEETDLTMCGKILKSKGLVDPFIEVYLDAFEDWSEDDRCKLCSKQIKK